MHTGSTVHFAGTKINPKRTDRTAVVLNFLERPSNVFEAIFVDPQIDPAIWVGELKQSEYDWMS